MKARKVWAFVLALVMVVTTMFVDMPVRVNAADAPGLIPSNIKFVYIVDGVQHDITDGSEIPENAEVKLSFDWAISNISDGQQIDSDIVVELPLELNNLKLNLLSDTPYNDTQGFTMGTYSITNDKFILTVTKEYYDHHSDRQGRASLEGTLDVDNSDNADKKIVPISALGQNLNIVALFNQVESSISVTKSTNGSAKKNPDGSFTQSFSVTLSCQGDEVKDLVLTELPGGYLSNPTNFKYNGQTYASLDDVCTAIKANSTNGTGMDKNQTATFTYDMTVSAEAAAANADYSKGNNKIKAEYKTNLDNPEEKTSSDAHININLPSVNKNGQVNNDGTISWTITINVGTSTWADVDLSSIQDMLKELKSDGTTLGSYPKTISKSDFTTADGGQTYTYTYSYTPSDEAKTLSGTEKVRFKNEVKDIVIDGTPYSDDAEVSIGKDNWASKSFVGYDAATKQITWKIAIDIPATGTLKDLKIQESLYQTTGKHLFDKNGATSQIKLTDGNHSGTVVIENNVSKEPTVISPVYYDETGYQYHWMFNDAYIASLQAANKTHIELEFKTQITEDVVDGKTFTNKASVVYNYDGSNGEIPVEAEYKDTTENATYKKLEGTNNGEAKLDNGILTYTIWANLGKMNSSTVAANDEFVFEDTLPSEFKFKEVTFVGAGQVDGWFDTNTNYPEAVSTNASGSKVTFTVKLSSDMATKLNGIGDQNKGVFIKYKVAIKDPVAFKAAGKHEVKNEVKCSYNNNPIGTAIDKTKIEPEDIVQKSMTYSKLTAPNVEFKIIVNPMAADLNANGDTLLAEDTMGTALVFNEGSLNVTAKDDNGLDVPITPQYTYDIHNNKLSFNLPDNKSIVITYTARLCLYVDPVNENNNDHITFDNAGNTFTLDGIDETDTKEDIKQYTIAYSSNVEGSGGSDGITLWKYYLDANTVAHNLGGSGFAVYDTQLKNGKYEVTNHVKAAMKLNDTEYKWQVNGLALDTVYAVVETDAATGFKLNTDPMFFVLKGRDYNDVVWTDQLNTFFNHGYIKYENEQGNTTSLTVTKTLTGDITAAKAEATIKFHITSDAGFDRTYDLKTADADGNKFVKDINGVYKLTLNNIAPAKYTVEELVTDITGKTRVTTYKIDAGNSKNGKKTDITIKNGDTPVVAFTNDYTDEKTELTVKKVWDDNNNQDGKRTTSIQVKLTADGTQKGEAVTLNSANNWTYTWKNLVKYDNEQLINYTVDEVSVPTGYTKTVTNDPLGSTSYTIKNTHAPEKRSINVTKVWNHGINTTKPSSVTIELYADGIKIDSKVAKESDSWKASFTNLPVYKNGKKIVYEVKEVEVTGYEGVVGVIDETTGNVTVTNTFKPGKITYNVEKVWEDNNDQDGIRPEYIQVQLYRKIAGQGQGTAVGAPVTITADTNWKYTWSGLDIADASDNIYEYYVDEVNVPTGYVLAGIDYDGYTATITNGHITETTQVKVLKKWTDDNNQDNVRPTSVSVKLLANGVVKGTARTLNVANGWTYTWTDLPKYANGEEIVYTVDEVAIPTGYTKTVTKDTQAQITTYTIENTHVSETRDIEVTKVWEHGTNTQLPTEVTINLLADNVVKDSKVAKEATNWKVTFTNLPVYKDGKKIVYRVTEDAVSGYKTVITPVTDAGKATVTNTYAPEYTTFTVVKAWDDNNNQDGKRPETVTVQLQRKIDGGTNEDCGTPVTVKASEGWTYTWDNLLLKDASDNEYIYSAVEVGEPTGYIVDSVDTVGDTTTITNKHTPEIMGAHVEKLWTGDNFATHPDVKVQLLADGVEVGTPLTLSEINSFEGDWANLPVYKNGSKIVYSIVEIQKPDGYAATYKTLPSTTDGDGNVVAQFTVTNAYPSTKRKVVKVWDDNDDQDGVRPESIDVALLANGVEVSRVTLDEANNWSYEWPELQKNSNGIAIEYTVAEYLDTATSSEYVLLPVIYPIVGEINNGQYTIYMTNTHTTKTTSIDVEKKWVDNDDQDGARPEYVTVQLYADNKLVPGTKITLDDSNSWKYTYDSLPMYNAGKLIKYSVVEDGVSGYTADYSPSTTNSGTITITNTHTPGKTTKIVKKVWEDNNNQDGVRPAGIEVQLYKKTSTNKIPVGTKVTLNNANNWQYKWTNLDEKENGVAIVYVVEEVNVPEGYIVSYDNQTNLTTITNTHNTDVTSIEVEKVWDDNNNQDGVRPENVTVTLYANGVSTGKTAVLSEATNWKAKFNNIPKKRDGVVVQYSVVEKKIADYKVSYSPAKATEGKITVTNSYTPGKTYISVNKIWDDEDNVDNIRTESVKVQLYKIVGETKTEVGKPVELSAENDWTYTWENLDEKENGVDIRYVVDELDVPEGYTSDVQIDQNDNYAIINTHKPEQFTEITVNKIWDDNDNQDGVRPETLEVQLTANGEPILEPVVLDEENEWSYTWKELPVLKDGKEIKYSVIEETVEGYVPDYDLSQIDEGIVNIVNSYNPEATSLTVNKVWDDMDDADGVRPGHIKVKLYGDEELVDTVELSAKNGWTYTWSDLDKYADGEEIDYTVEEVEVKGYTTMVTLRDDGNIIITNVHKPGKPKTGDTAKPIAALALMTLCGAAFMILMINKKRRSN